MKKKKLLTLLGSLCLIIVLAALPFTADSAAKPKKAITLSVVTFVPEGNNLLSAFWPVLKRINERAGGELILKYKGGPETIGMFDQGEAVQRGVVDIAWVPGTFYPGVVPGIEALMFSNLTATEQRASGGYDAILNLHKQKGLYYLGHGIALINDFFHIILSKKVERPQDLAGLRFGDGTIGVAGLKALGAVPVVTAPPEIYTAIERGVLDGTAFPVVGMVDWGWGEVAKYLINHGFESDDVLWTINKDKWNSLPKHLQDLIMEEVIRMETESVGIYKQLEAKEKQILQKAGIEFIEFSPADAAFYNKTFAEADWDLHIKRYPKLGPKLKKVLWK